MVRFLTAVAVSAAPAPCYLRRTPRPPAGTPVCRFPPRTSGIAALHANTHDVARVLDLLEESAARHEPDFGEIRSPESFPGVRHEPRFVKLLQSLETGGR